MVKVSKPFVFSDSTKVHIPVRTITVTEIVLGVSLFVSLVGTGFVSWRLWHQSHRKKENTRKDKRKNIEMVEDKNATDISRSEGETSFYTGICSLENHYQGLQRTNVFNENRNYYVSQKEKKVHEGYEEIGQVNSFVK